MLEGEPNPHGAAARQANNMLGEKNARLPSKKKLGGQNAPRQTSRHRVQSAKSVKWTTRVKWDMLRAMGVKWARGSIAYSQRARRKIGGALGVAVNGIPERLGRCGKDTLLRKIVACPAAHFVERTQETTQKTTRLVSRGARKKER